MRYSFLGFKVAIAGGGAMANASIHALDTERFLLGDPQPVSIFAQIGTHYEDLKVARKVLTRFSLMGCC